MEKQLRNLLDHLKTWLDRYRKAGEAVPSVQRTLESIEWQLGVLEQRPSEGVVLPMPEIEEQADLVYKTVMRDLPMIPEYDPEAVSFVTSVTNIGSSMIHTLVSGVAVFETPQAREYAEDKAKAYRELQASQNRPEEVQQLLGQVLPTTTAKFDIAYKAYYAAKSGAGTRTAAALEMRTLLDVVKGELFDKARNQPKENMTWEKMTQRFLPGPEPLTAMRRTQLIMHEGIRSRLVEDLSTTAKQWEGAHPNNLDDMWTRLIDHLHIVLNLIPRSAI